MKPDPKRESMVFRALPDSEQCSIRLKSDGQPELAMPNHSEFSPSVEATLANAYELRWFSNTSETLDPMVRRGVNLCADASDYARSMVFLDSALPPNVPVFNHPRTVMASRRDNTGRRLTGIAGLQIPACRRFAANDPRAFNQCFEDGSSPFR